MTLRNSSRFVLRDLGLARTRPFTTTRASVVGGGNRRNFFVYIETAPAAGSPSPSRPHLPHPTVSPARRIVRSNGSIKYKQRHLVLRPSAPRATQLIRISREFWILRERLVPGRWGSGNRSALMKLNAGGKWDGWDGWVHVSASASFPRPSARQAQGDQGGSRARAFMNLGQDERLLPPLSLSLSLSLDAPCDTRANVPSYLRTAVTSARDAHQSSLRSHRVGPYGASGERTAGRAHWNLLLSFPDRPSSPFDSLTRLATRRATRLSAFHHY
jgi:hypothetical protein